MKIVILDGYTANPGDLSWDKLKAFGEVVVYDRTSPAQVKERSSGANMLLTNKTVISRELMEACSELNYIGVLATGYNVVDLQAAKELGITVTNIPAYSTDSVVQMTFALLFELCTNVGIHNAAVKSGKWENAKDFCFWETPLIAVKDKVFGIVGYGKIGRAVAEAAKAFGKKVCVCTRTPSKVADPEIEVLTREELFAKADIISLHCPLTEENKEMINRESIAKMKEGVILLNTGRGPLINEADLAEALHSGKIYAAGVDVVSVEPIKAENPLLSCDNCIITPHIAWAPKETRARLIEIAVENVKSFMEGTTQNRVN